MNSRPLAQLVLARLREFSREPEALFWVYGFPLLMVIALGIAFRNKPVERSSVAVAEGPDAAAIESALEGQNRFKTTIHDADTCRLKLRTGKIDLVIFPGRDDAGSPRYEYAFDATRPESVLARNAADDRLQRHAGRTDAVKARDLEWNESTRYIDFLVPGLLGMNIMGGGLWGVGFVTVDMRIRKLLKRFLATPMKKRDFLLGLMISRLIFLVPDVLILLVFARFAFGVEIQGSLLAIAVLVLLGSFTFAGLGLLIASRAQTMEAVSGLMNLVMLPMWILSGIFFSADRFPEMAQPFIKMLPLTPLIDSLRAVMLEGATLPDLMVPMSILLGWGAVSFLLALRWFRWS